MFGKKTEDNQDERKKTFDKASDIMSYVCNEGLCPGESFIINQTDMNHMIIHKKDGDILIDSDDRVVNVLIQSLIDTLNNSNRNEYAKGKEFSVPISMDSYISSIGSSNNSSVFMTSDWLDKIVFDMDTTRQLKAFRSFINERDNNFIHINTRTNSWHDIYDVFIEKDRIPIHDETGQTFTMNVISNIVNNDIRTTIIITNDAVTDDDIHRSDSIMKRIPSIIGRGSMTIIADNRDFGALLSNISDHTIGSGLIAYIGAKPRSLSNPMIVQMISADQYQPYKIDNAINMHCLGIIIDDVTNSEVCRHAIIASLSGLDVYLLMRGRNADDVQAKFEALVDNHAYIEAFESQKKSKSIMYSSIIVQ